MTSLLFLVALASDRHSNVGMPAGAYWRLGPEPTGEQLNALLAELEAACPHQLEDALATVSLTAAPVAALRGTFKYICRFLLSDDRERDIFGAAFMAGQSLSAAQRLGAFHTPTCVTEAIAAMVAIGNGGGDSVVSGGALAPTAWVIEPSCGTGAIILSAIDKAIATYGPDVAQSITYIGVELNPASARLARMNMVLAGAAEQSAIFCGDGLTRDIIARCTTTGRTMTVVFDLCLANPPFGGAGVNVASLVAGEPFVIPERLLDRPVAVPDDFTPRARTAPVDAPPPRPEPRPGEQLGFDIPEAA
jgi:type I restriction-modification system DNA methylase subunit